MVQPIKDAAAAGSLGLREFSWYSILFGYPVLGIWYWCTDQYIVQRTLAAKDLRTARRGALWGAFLKVWPVLIFLIPGLIGAALNHEGLLALPVDAAGSTSGDQVFPTMVAALLPAGLRGLVVAGMLAALMSSLSSLFNSTATLFTVDVYDKLYPGAPERRLVVIGRVATVVVVVLGLLWIPVMPLVSKGGLYQYLQSVQGYLGPPITAVFLLGIFNSRINNRGAVWGLGLGLVLGMAKLLIQSLFGAGKRESHDSSDYYRRRMASHVIGIVGQAVPPPTEVLDRLYCQSSESMDQLPDNCVSLMVTSPPYNVGKEYDEDLHIDEYLDLLRGVFAETYRVLEPGGRIAVNVDAVYRQLDPMPAGFSRFWIEHELRGRLGFGGAVFCDTYPFQIARQNRPSGVPKPVQLQRVRPDRGRGGIQGGLDHGRVQHVARQHQSAETARPGGQGRRAVDGDSTADRPELAGGC